MSIARSDRHHLHRLSLIGARQISSRRCLRLYRLHRSTALQKRWGCSEVAQTVAPNGQSKAGKGGVYVEVRNPRDVKVAGSNLAVCSLRLDGAQHRPWPTPNLMLTCRATVETSKSTALATTAHPPSTRPGPKAAH